MDETGDDPQYSWANEDVGNSSGGGPYAPAATDEHQISELAPKEARTKGRKRGEKQVVNDDASSSMSQGRRTCSYCGALRHYSTGCPINSENASKKRGASGSLTGKMGRKRRRPPTKRQLEDEFDDVA
jgi:hypothetical protein